MKILTTLLVFALCCNSTTAQKACYTIGVHSSIAVGDFGSTDLQNGAFAAAGYGLLLENKFSPSYFPEKLGIGFHFTYQEFEVDDQALGQAFSDLIGGDVSARAFAGKYRPLTANFIGFYDFPITENLTFEVKGGVGVLFTILDPIQVDVYDDQGNNILKSQVDFETKPYFNFMFGADLGYKFSESWGIGLYADYSNSSVDITASYLGVNTGSNQNIGFINAGFGITYILK